jgi:hypothetical protein
MKDVLVEVSADTPVPPDVVLAKVIAMLPGATEVDRDRRFVALQGGWWYRGEYQVTPTPTGSTVVHRVRNVARRGRWAVPLANRMFIGFREQTERGFAEFVSTLT